MLKTKLFYSDLVKLKDLLKELDQFQLSAEERDEVFDLLDDIFHHRILDSLLDILPESHHQDFLDRFARTPHDIDLLEYLRQHTTSDPQAKIITTFEIVKREVLLDIHLAKPKKTSRMSPSQSKQKK